MNRSLAIATLLSLVGSAHAADPRAKAVSQIKYLEKAHTIAATGRLTPHLSLVEAGRTAAGTVMDSRGRRSTVLIRDGKVLASTARHESNLLKAIHEGHAAASEMKQAVERLDYNRALERRGGMYSIMAHTDAVVDGGNSQFERAQAKLDKAVAKVTSEHAKLRATPAPSVTFRPAAFR